MANLIDDLLRKTDEIVIHNPTDLTRLYATRHLSAWLAESNEYASSGHELISPGGAARAVGVTRQQIYNWCYLSRRLTCFVCRPSSIKRGESYCLVDLAQARQLALELAKHH